MVTTLIETNQYSISPYNLTGTKLTAVKTTQKMAIQIPILMLEVQYWMIKPAAVNSRAHVIAPSSMLVVRPHPAEDGTQLMGDMEFLDSQLNQ